MFELFFFLFWKTVLVLKRNKNLMFKPIRKFLIFCNTWEATSHFFAKDNNMNSSFDELSLNS